MAKIRNLPLLPSLAGTAKQIFSPSGFDKVPTTQTPLRRAKLTALFGLKTEPNGTLSSVARAPVLTLGCNAFITDVLDEPVMLVISVDWTNVDPYILLLLTGAAPRSAVNLTMVAVSATLTTPDLINFGSTT